MALREHWKGQDLAPWAVLLLNHELRVCELPPRQYHVTVTVPRQLSCRVLFQGCPHGWVEGTPPQGFYPRGPFPLLLQRHWLLNVRKNRQHLMTGEMAGVLICLQSGTFCLHC